MQEKFGYGKVAVECAKITNEFKWKNVVVEGEYLGSHSSYVAHIAVLGQTEQKLSITGLKVPHVI